jgi:cytoskeletal protein CcmA (bactofilin family)
MEVQTSAVIHGDITTSRLAVDEGAVICGHIHMTKPKGTGNLGHDVVRTESSPTL